MYVNDNTKFDVDMNISNHNSFAKSRINIHSKNAKTPLGVVYRHTLHNRDSSEKFIRNLEETYLKLNQQKRKFVVMGDFNIDLVQISSNLDTRNVQIH